MQKGFAFIADLDIKFNRHKIFTWWLRIPYCGSWENCLKYERNPEIARLPTLVPQRCSGSLQQASSVPVQHCQRSMDQTPAWVPHHFQNFKSRARGTSSYKSVQVCVRTTPATRWLDISSDCSFVLVGKYRQHKSSTSLLSFLWHRCRELK